VPLPQHEWELKAVAADRVLPKARNPLQRVVRGPYRNRLIRRLPSSVVV